MKRNKLVSGADGRSYLVPFILVTTLFFLWGFAHSILDVLNKHFQEAMEISKTRSALIQTVVYGGYFLMAIPAGEIIRKYGYRAGVITGLILYGVGALLFIPGSRIVSFEFFLFSLFVIGCGLTCLETAANPYVTVLGDRDGAERRLNLAQAFNGLGWIFGPLVGGLFLFSAKDGSSDIATPYAIIGVVVLVVALIFSRIKLPEINMKGDGKSVAGASSGSLWEHLNFKYGLITLFLYVAAQTGINSFFINYVTEHTSINTMNAALLLSFGGMGLFMAGRMIGSVVMRGVKAEKVLALCALVAVISVLVVISGSGMPALVSLLICYLCESIMFPTIFALSIRGVGEHTKRASSYLIMSIVGGAIAPPIMGYIADNYNMAIGFVVPAVCFVAIFFYAMYLVRRK